jgi:hypothetical protein
LALFPNAETRSVGFEYGGALTALPTGDVWAVGTVNGGSFQARPYVQHLCPIPVSDGMAHAAPTATRAKNDVTRSRLGAGVAWKFMRSNRKEHRVRDASGMKLFDSGLKRRGASYTIDSQPRDVISGLTRSAEARDRYGPSQREPARPEAQRQMGCQRACKRLRV